MTVVSAAVVAFAMQMYGSMEDSMSLILLTFLLAGLFQVIFGFLNVASYVKYFPYPVISGFMSGVGLIIVILQIFPFVGLDSAKSTFAVIQDLPRLFVEANLSALMLGVLTIVIYFLVPKITRDHSQCAGSLDRGYPGGLFYQNGCTLDRRDPFWFAHLPAWRDIQC